MASKMSEWKEEALKYISGFKGENAFPTLMMKREVKEQYIEMANGGDGAVSMQGNIRKKYYDGKPDEFFQHICDEIGWKWNEEGRISKRALGPSQWTPGDRVALSRVGNLVVSTVYCGQHYHPPGVFETLVMYKPPSNFVDKRYWTEEDAKKGHKRICKQLKKEHGGKIEKIEASEIRSILGESIGDTVTEIETVRLEETNGIKEKKNGKH